MVAWDPRGYGYSRPPDRDFPVDFFERDAKDAIDLMKVGFPGKSLRRAQGREDSWACLNSSWFCFFITMSAIPCNSYRKFKEFK